ncbi:unnamed protein product [Brachionus calyciflorus]|uniref:Uncharacterized protein n=1 Tax=Brachionus calyciflorus TaxID=104777 RepID=A0A814RBC8_9BILA|nr:unnamed protein product [Brachionus calyciflorus]
MKPRSAVEEVDLLGFIISKNRIKPNPNRAKCLLEKPKPINIRELQCWLGIAKGYRTFIDGYAQIVSPMYDLMGLKDVPKKFRKKMVPFMEKNSHRPFAINMDSKQKKCPSTLRAMVIRVSIYDFKIEYIPGPKIIIADSFSRLPYEDEPNQNKTDDYCDNLVAIVEEVIDDEESTDFGSNENSNAKET